MSKGLIIFKDTNLQRETDFGNYVPKKEDYISIHKPTNDKDEPWNKIYRVTGVFCCFETPPLSEKLEPPRKPEEFLLNHKYISPVIEVETVSKKEIEKNFSPNLIKLLK